ncbi:MAG: tetratricopeptide repeat protein [Deltaproteobacteria bacterium]|nr:tetratricopeptide repeat protein [Deltaproteobacteria bacterium]
MQRATEVALLYAANVHYNLKEYDKAIEIYNRLLFKIEREDPSLHGNINEIKVAPGITRDSAVYGMAYSYEQKGDLKKAVEFQTMLTSSKDTHLMEMGLSSLGMLYEKSNDKAKALETYQKVISDFPESSNLSGIKEKIERLKAKG